MRFQFSARLIAGRLIAVTLMAAAGAVLLSILLTARFAQAQAAATATPRSAAAPITYTVKSGDSFNAIARQFNLTPQQLQALNAITDTGVIRVGQVLIVGVSTFTPAPPSTSTPAPTPTAAPTRTPTTLPTETPTVEPTTAPTLAPIDEPSPTSQPIATAVPITIEPPAAPGVPIDVIVVGAIMLLAVIGIIIGFRTQRS